MIRNRSIKIIRFLFSKVIIFYHGGIWKLKERMSIMKYSYLKSVYLSIYTKYFDNHNSYVGSRCKLQNIPIFPHGIKSIFISDDAVIGTNCIIFQQVTIGSNNFRESNSFGSPTIGDSVIIGAGAKIIGKVSIGDNCRIGANAVVYKDMPDNTTAVMQPTRLIPKTRDSLLYTKRETKDGIVWGYYGPNGKWVLDKEFKI